MPILDIQRRQTEVGRIRIGESVDTGRKNRSGQAIRKPVKLDKFRFTSASRTLIEQVTAMYGGTPAEWVPQGGGAKQWEVYTEARAILVVVPPNAVSQWYESWSGGMCVRRCDGQRELLRDTPCVCPPDPSDRDAYKDCKPTTRISLMLADIPGIGVWRLETHGFYAATELPAVAELLAAAGGYVPGRLEIEQRTAKRPKANGDGVETRHWMVPVLHVDAAPKALLAGGGNGAGAPALTGQAAPAIEAPKPALTADQVLAWAPRAKSVEQVQQLWRDANNAEVLTVEVKAALTARANELGAPAKPVSAPPATTPAGAAPVQPVEGEVEPNKDKVWMEIVSETPDEWGTSGLQQRVASFLGKPLAEADGFELRRFYEAMLAGQVSP